MSMNYKGKFVPNIAEQVINNTNDIKKLQTKSNKTWMATTSLTGKIILNHNEIEDFDRLMINEGDMILGTDNYLGVILLIGSTFVEVSDNKVLITTISGPPGATGATGPIGPPGKQGPQGDQGLPGVGIANTDFWRTIRGELGQNEVIVSHRCLGIRIGYDTLPATVYMMGQNANEVTTIGGYTWDIAWSDTSLVTITATKTTGDLPVSRTLYYKIFTLT